ncbi:MATE family efflux transporter [Treponema pectinovorum]|uniref:MATE family efflux transporter n=2 Tax=Treponema pectinovorum TaxID=164 RepID=UPI0011C79770|nr:MATE family efflux transporter [Treponema pectinovorum]
MLEILERKNLLKGFYKTLFSLAIPIILQNLMQTFVNMLDTIMVGRLGAVEIAAVGLGNQIYFMLSIILFGVSSGCGVFVSQYWGQQNIKGIRRTVGIMLFVCTFFSILFFIAGFFLPDKLFSLYTKDLKVIAQGVSYLKIVAFSYPFTAISFAFQMAFRNTERVYLPMVCTAISLVLNGIFNYIFIFGTNFFLFGQEFSIQPMGVSGAALATMICRIIEFFIVIIYSYSRHYEVCGKIAEFFDFDFSFIKKVFKIAFPVLVSETVWGLGITTQNAIFARAGTFAIAAFNITNTINQLTWVFFIGMGNASAVILGKKIGAEDIEGAKAYVQRSSWFMPLMGAIIGLLLIPLSFSLKFIFKVDPYIISLAQSMIYVLMCVYPLRAFNMLLIVGACRAGGDTIFSMIIDNGFMWLISIPLAFVAAFWWNLPPFAIMLFLETEQVFKVLAGAWRVKSGKWLHMVTH